MKRVAAALALFGAACAQAAPDETTVAAVAPTVREASDPTEGVDDAMWRSTSTTQRASRARRRSHPAPSNSDRSRGLLLACIRLYEGSYTTATGNGYYGAYQFDLRTWRGAVTRAGHGEWADRLPSDAPPSVQDSAALQLLSERGLQPWPTPAKKCA